MARAPKTTAKTKAPARRGRPAKAAAKAPRATKAAAAPAAKPKAIKVSTEAGKTITQSALLQLVADQNGMKRTEAKAFVESYLDIVKAHVLKGVKVKLGDLGTMLIRSRKARMGRNPATGEQIKIKASKKLAFRVSSTMKAAVK
jgi:nucleoid DNA-binding protein